MDVSVPSQKPSKMTILKSSFTIFTIFLLTHSICLSQNVYDTLKTVKMTAIANHQDINLTIQWKDDPGFNTYSLYKKMSADTVWGNPLIVTEDQDTSYLDLDIEAGSLYEYRIVKETGNNIGYAYLFSGVNYLPVQKKGDVLLLVDSSALDEINDNLTAYIKILGSEGWIPWLETVGADASVSEVKALILQYNENVDSLSTILLMGDIAVPHSGDINPDAHNNHKGAWPADLYYGDINGIWTDETVNNVSSAYPRLHNIPGDGNFDQGFVPGEIELAIGRMDFSELPIFDLNEYELLDRYLQKNIAYRTGEYQVKRQAVFKNINPWVEGLGQNAIRNFTPLVSPDSIVYEDFFDAFYDSFLWSYGGSSGSMLCSNGLGCIDTYANNNFQTVFTAYFGSYYGDYDFENNFLRTILASGKVLSTAWVGAPNWYFHPMGMGLDLGACTLLTQNNEGLYYAGYFPKSVTINLLGDPTLKAYIVLPPDGLQAIQNGNQMELTWSPSADNILGYQVYKKSEDMDYFEPLNLLPISDTSFVDSCVIGETAIQYLVKAVKREITPSGSFINHSTGPIVNVQTSPNILPEANFNLSWEQGILSGMNFSINANQYQWILPDGMSTFEEHFEIPYNQNGMLSVTLLASNACFSDSLTQDLIITDLSDIIDENQIQVYPNPTEKYITIETAAFINEINLYNSLGVHILTESNLASGTHQINIQNLVQGNYLLELHFPNEVITKMIFIKM